MKKQKTSLIDCVALRGRLKRTEHVIDQVLDQDLALGVHASTPPRIDLADDSQGRWPAWSSSC